MSERSTWTTTTHRWVADMDTAHLAEVRKALTGPHISPGTAGGVRHLILEVLAYAQGEAASQNRVGNAVVVMHSDGSVTVDDDGRGTDTRRDSAGNVIRKPVMATEDVRFWGNPQAPLLPDGLPRRGMSSVAALSSELVHENHRENGSWSQTYRCGLPDDALKPIPDGGRSGTSVRFRAELPGPGVLEGTDFEAFANLRIEVRDELEKRSPQEG